MEIVIAIFLGAWLSAACVLAYLQLKKDFSGLDAQEKRQTEGKTKQ